MQRVATAFGVLGKILKVNGRRKVRAECEIRMRLIRDDQGAARFAPMEDRKTRRAIARRLNIPFRPVYFYKGSGAPGAPKTIRHGMAGG